MEAARLGFVGLGVMGEPMCRNLARKSGRSVVAWDIRREPLDRLAADGVKAAGSLRELSRNAELIFLSLPGEKEIREAVSGLKGNTVVDCSTAPVALARELASAMPFADAPVARTRQAAIDGTLSIMVGASDAVFAHIRPVLETMGSDVTHCGPVGSGQVAKILNNMLVFQNTAALAEAIAIGRRNGVPPEVLLPTIAKGSGDSFVLRSHGMKSMLPRDFPERAFSTRYAIKDLSYALEMAEAAGLAVPGAELTMQRLRQSEEAGNGEAYHPAVLCVIDPA